MQNSAKKMSAFSPPRGGGARFPISEIGANSATEFALTRRINIALQGGGAHGAFTWGVVDRLLQEDEIEIAGISGTSAGALNGAAIKAGMIHGGRQGARDNLAWFWGRSRAFAIFAWPTGCVRFSRRRGWSASRSSIPCPMPLPMPGRGCSAPIPTVRFTSNPLKPIVDRFHYDEVCAASGPRSFSCRPRRCARARSGCFQGGEITPDGLVGLGLFADDFPGGAH